MSKDSQKTGIELSQNARFLFDEAANNWYLSIIIQFFTGVTVVFLSFLNFSDDWKLLFAILVFLALISAYRLRVIFDAQYDQAETMRRQAALSEGLGLPICSTQLSEWRRRAGSKIETRLDQEPRNQDYYATQENLGPKKLLGMTIESAFYTRHLYAKLRDLIRIVLVITTFFSIIVLTVLPFNIVPKNIAIKAAYALYLLLPVMLSVDLLLYWIKLGRLISSICDIEKDLEKLEGENNLEEAPVIRLVSEYNCQVTAGIPIHNLLFNKWHSEIRKAWNKRIN